LPKIKTKARALDMLGRQQIAGIPTALSELFKNSHDTYADRVEVDFIRKKNLLILRDDGLGMTREEFEQRWLTIGTDSKLDDEDGLQQPAIDVNKKPRQIMGEKGIGRLSIAAIGPQLLVLTRAKRGENLDNLVAAFVNWTLFSLPALDLEDIDIPMMEIEGGKNLTKVQFDGLLSQSKENVASLAGKISRNKIESICDQIDAIDFDPEFWTKALGGLHLDEDGFGTHFVISPVDEILSEEIASDDFALTTDRSSRLEKALLGFTNTMYSDSKPPIIAAFRDHTLQGECIDRIGESIFFTPDEFDIADHHFEGIFNEFGQFHGNVQIYGKEKQGHVISWPDGNNKQTSCGPFKIKLAYVHGTQRQTIVSPALWQDLRRKTERLGGLYIYRDGIRVLPYGDVDFDFLRIEQRRSKHASEYFFSYRNMFGAVELTKSINGALQEKAGREGFIENKAYKQFKAILENFFIQAARDFFVERGAKSELFFEQRKRNVEAYELIKKRENLKGSKKKKLETALEKFFSKLDDGYWRNKIDSIKTKTEHIFDSFNIENNEIDDFVFEVQQHLNTEVGKLQRKVDISRPAGIGLGKDLTNLWDRYQIEKTKIEEIVTKFKDDSGRRLVEFEDRYGDRTGLRRRFNDSLQTQQEFHTKQINEVYAKAKNSIEELQKWAKTEINESRKIAKDDLEQVKYDFGSTSFANKSSDDLFEVKKSLESRITETSSAVIKKIEQLTSQLKTAQEGTEESAVSSNQLTEVLETEYEHLKEQNEQNMEMVLLGMALGVVHHEFNGNIRAIRSGLRDMQPWAQKNEKLLHIYSRIRTGFDHLDGYLKTFSPLTRRLSRKKVKITGQAVSEFIKDVFAERIEKEHIEINFTNAFFAQHVNGFTSTIYPALVNLVDNAIHWLSKSSGDRVITLDANDRGFLIKDSGPGIPSIDRENVFEFGFTRKVGGQGMGLYVAKQTLEADGFEITLGDYQSDEGATFYINPKKDINVIDYKE
jgi:signal transduction histidine kinase